MRKIISVYFSVQIFLESEGSAQSDQEMNLGINLKNDFIGVYGLDNDEKALGSAHAR